MSNGSVHSMDEVVDLLPTLESPPELAKPVPGFEYVRETDPPFVPPELKLTRPPEGDEPTVLIISAPAAVGKSTLANELAARVGAPLWDLAEFQVGSHSFEGTLATAYGMGTATTLLDQLHDGDFMLVLDALDEGELRAGSENFQAFLEGLTESMRAATNGPAIVAFARTDTADSLELNCYENDVDVSRYEIRYFTRDQAVEFIESQLDAICDAEDANPTHRRFREPFEQARDTLNDLVISLLDPDSSDPWESQVVRGFLGYAPVLEAISRYLRVDNYASLQTDLDAAQESLGEGERVHLWEFLADIVESVMDREHEKIRDNLRDQLEDQAQRVGFDDWDSVYSRDEQRSRLLHRYLLETAPPALPDDLPAFLRGPYEERMETTVSQHPFIGHRSGEFANVVFRDYLFAKTLAEDRGEASEAVRAQMSGQSLLTPLFGRFLLSFAGNGEEPKIAADDFSFLYESLRSESRDDLPIYLTLQQAPDTSTAVGVMTAGREVTPDVRFRLSLDGDGVRFLRRLSYADINLDSPVALGTDRGSFVLGPSVKLDCQELRPVAESIQIRPKSEDTEESPNVLVLAEGYRSSGAQPDVDALGNPDEIGVYWPEVAYPWVDYRLSSRPAAEVDDVELTEALKYFSRILTFFRSYGYGGLGRRTETINEAAVGESEMAQDLLDYLLRDGLIRREGQFFQLDSARLDTHGITWADVNNRSLNEGTRQLLTDFLQTRSET